MAYETNLLDPLWWINSLLGNVTMLVILIEIWLLSYIRQIPNMKSFSLILLGINAMIVIFAVFSAEGLTLTTGVLVFLMAIFGFIAFSGFSDS